MLATPPATLLGDGQVEGRDEPEPSASRPVKPISSADWHLEPWQRQWRMNPPLPHSHVLDGLQEELPQTPGNLAELRLQLPAPFPARAVHRSYGMGPWHKQSRSRQGADDTDPAQRC